MALFYYGKRLHIYRIGFKDAVKILNQGGRIEIQANGTPYVIASDAAGGCVEGYLTRSSFTLLKSHNRLLLPDGKEENDNKRRQGYLYHRT
jgi:hypothetical protein